MNKQRDASVRFGNITADDMVWLTPGKDGELDIQLPEQGMNNTRHLIQFSLE
jgi:hypothetical protein